MQERVFTGQPIQSTAVLRRGCLQVNPMWSTAALGSAEGVYRSIPYKVLLLSAEGVYRSIPYKVLLLSAEGVYRSTV